MFAIAELCNESLSSNKWVLASLSDLTNNFNKLSSLVSDYLKVENAKLRSKLDDLKLKVNYSDSTGFSVQTPVLVSHILQEYLSFRYAPPTLSSIVSLNLLMQILPNVS